MLAEILGQRNCRMALAWLGFAAQQKRSVAKPSCAAYTWAPVGGVIVNCRLEPE
jgi:hypothetical protein